MTKNDKVNNLLQEIHAITSHIDFEHIKVRENLLEDSLSRLKTLDLYEANDPEELEREYGKSIFDIDSEIICNVNISQHSNREFEIKSIKYLDEKYLEKFLAKSTDVHSTCSG